MKPSTVIAMFCYKRAGKLQKAVEALLKNPECANMDIIFICDGPKNDEDAIGVEATRSYIDTIKGFKSVIKRYREKNISTGPNFHEGLTYLCSQYDQFIVTEDDLVVSPNFIKYSLDALDFYRNDTSVFCITGFAFPLKPGRYIYDSIIHHRFCSYGWASWSDRVREVKWDAPQLINLIEQSPDFKKRLNTQGLDLFRMLKKQITGKISTWDIQMQVHVSEHHLKVIYPLLSKTCNIGFDNESTNTFGIDYLKTIVDTGEQQNFRFCNANKLAPALQKQLKKPYSFKSLVVRKIGNTLIKLTNSAKKSAAIH